VFLSSCLFHLLTYGLIDDHFDRISRGRQIAQYGELPFRDFFDPGFFLTIFSSAAVQRVFGDNLLGEALLNIVCFSVGFTLVFLLLTRTARSIPFAMFVTALVVATEPRFYDYDKVLFYPLGVFLCWRYIDRPCPRDLIALGLGTAIAFWFRYDNGLYIACAAGVSLAVVHWDNRITLVRRLGLYSGIVVLVSVPFLVFLQLNGGVLEYIYQIASYANREGRRTDVFRPPGFSIDTSAPLLMVDPVDPGYPVKVRWIEGTSVAERSELEWRFALENPEVGVGQTWSYLLKDRSVENVRGLLAEPRVEDTNSIDRATGRVPGQLTVKLRRVVPLMRMRLLPGIVSRDNALASLYYLFLGIPCLALMLVWRNVTRGPPEPWRTRDTARTVALATMCILIDIFILRAPISARIGAVAPPIAVLGGWVIVNLRDRRTQSADVTLRLAGGSGAGGDPPRQVRSVWRITITCIVVLTCLTVGALTVLNARLGQTPWSTTDVLDRWSDVLDRLTDLTMSPPTEKLLPAGRYTGLVQYARDCTGPNDRLLATWYFPLLYFYAWRGFGGGMVFFLDGHWSELPYQQEILKRLSEQSVPIVFINVERYDSFQNDYGLIDDYLRANYRIAGDSNFGAFVADPPVFRVMVQRDLTPSRTHERWQLPCFQ